MSLLFLIPLTITIGAVVVPGFVQDDTGEVATFGTAIALLTFLLALILAPWWVKLILLLLILNRSRLISLLHMLFRRKMVTHAVSSPSHNQATGHAGSEATGQTIDSTSPTLEPTSDAGNSDAVNVNADGAVVCQYRGASWTFDPNPDLPDQPPKVSLRYRGAIVR